MSRLKKKIENYYTRCKCRNKHSFIGYPKRKSKRLNKCNNCIYYEYKAYYTCNKDYTNPFPTGCKYYKEKRKEYIQLKLF